TEIKEEITFHIGDQLSIGKSQALKSLVPNTVQAEKWYTRNVFEDLGVIWNLIQSYRDTKRLLAKAAFSAILLPVCRETRHWGYVCDNSFPKTNHEGNVLDELRHALDRLLHAYSQRDAEQVAQLGEIGGFEEALIVCADSREFLKQIPAGKINLVV